MKAVVLRAPGGLDRLELVELADPGAPGAGEIRVAIHATSLNFHDLLVVTGASPTEDGRIPMADGAGIVEAVGAGVTEFKPGDSVVSCFFPYWEDGRPATAGFSSVPGDGAHGFAQEFVVRPASAFTLAPKGWSHAEAATITTAGLTAWRALIVDGVIKPGDTVLTMGTGGVSIYALQIAKHMGAAVIATSSSQGKLDRLKTLGADHVVNYREDPNWGAAAYAISGRGVDVVVEIGGPGTLPQSIEAIRIGGHIALIGVLTGIAGDVPTVRLMGRQGKIQGIVVGNRAQQRDMVRAMETTGIRPVLDKSFKLGELAEAFKLQQAGGHFGKIVAEW